MQTTASGILRHHFHGDYSATIGLRFNELWQAVAAARRLGLPWAISKNDHAFVLATVGSEALSKKIIPQLAALGADPGKIDSVERSVDYGEPFTVTIELEHPDQLPLAL